MSILLSADDIARFYSKVGQPNANGCREWTGGKWKTGYGFIKIAGKQQSVHRVAWVLSNGRQVPSGLGVLHACDNPPCCEASHLFTGTQKDNMQDCAAKGRLSKTNLKGKRGKGARNPKLTKAQVNEIRAKYVTGTYMQAMLAREYKITRSTINKIVQHKLWI